MFQKRIKKNLDYHNFTPYNKFKINKYNGCFSNNHNLVRIINKIHNKHNKKAIKIKHNSSNIKNKKSVFN